MNLFFSSSCCLYIAVVIIEIINRTVENNHRTRQRFKYDDDVQSEQVTPTMSKNLHVSQTQVPLTREKQQVREFWKQFHPPAYLRKCDKSKAGVKLTVAK